MKSFIPEKIYDKLLLVLSLVVISPLIIAAFVSVADKHKHKVHGIVHYAYAYYHLYEIPLPEHTVEAYGKKH